MDNNKKADEKQETKISKYTQVGTKPRDRKMEK